MMFPRCLITILLTVPLCPNALTAEAIWDLEALSEAPEFRWVDEKSQVRSLLYAGLPYRGAETEVFAFYASPATLGNEAVGPFPGIVLIHGGGGTAFAEWVNLWAKRGYAAIAMDLGGKQPPAPEFDPESGAFLRHNANDREARKALKKPGPSQSHAEKFLSIGGEIDDDWPYHAVSNVILAHSLLDSFEEVDADRTAVTGISWGGYTTCIVASVDDRFQAAVPVYGCGFLHEGESVQKSQIDGLGERRDAWIAHYDPSSHLSRCRVPIFFVNGTNDIHYPLDSYAKSYRLVPGTRNQRIEVRMGHSHPAGWAPEEIGLFVDAFCRGAKPLPTIGLPTTEGDEIVATIDAEVAITGAQLHFTTDGDLRSKRSWKSAPATVKDGEIRAPAVPAETTMWLLSATDERGAMVTSEVILLD